MMMFIFPVNPSSSPVPESGTTLMDKFCAPRVIVPMCPSANVPFFPASVPFTTSIATYVPDPFAVPIDASISPVPALPNRLDTPCPANTAQSLFRPCARYPPAPSSRRTLPSRPSSHSPFSPALGLQHPPQVQAHTQQSSTIFCFSFWVSPILDLPRRE